MAYDIIGTKIILDETATKKQAQELLKQHKQIDGVFRKAGIHKGKYRTQKLIWLAGNKSKVTMHKESGCFFKLDIEKCYFSPRSSNERIRIKNLVKPAEKVLTLFDGVSPFSIIISKHTLAKEIHAVEINPTAHKYAKENLELNKIKNIKLYRGDVRKVLPRIKQKFDRIIMPHPSDSLSYLKLAKKYIKKNGIIHLYTFSQEKEFKDLKPMIAKYISKFKILQIVKAGVTSPFTYRVCVDIKVL